MTSFNINYGLILYKNPNIHAIQCKKLTFSYSLLCKSINLLKSIFCLIIKIVLYNKFKYVSIISLLLIYLSHINLLFILDLT